MAKRKRWKKLPGLPTQSGACLNCPPIRAGVSVKAVLSVGFGNVIVTKDGTQVWSGNDEKATLMRFENQARKDPNHDWRVQFLGAMNDKTYQRQGKNQWVLVKRGQGFA